MRWQAMKCPDRKGDTMHTISNHFGVSYIVLDVVLPLKAASVGLPQVLEASCTVDFFISYIVSLHQLRAIIYGTKQLSQQQ